MWRLLQLRRKQGDLVGKTSEGAIAFPEELGMGLASLLGRTANGYDPRGCDDEIQSAIPSDAILQRKEKWFQSLIEHSSDVVSLIDANGIILYKSPSIKRVLGFDDHELLGHHAFEVAHPDDREKLGLLFAQVLQLPPDQVLTGEFRHLRKDGTYCWMEGVASNLLSDPIVHAIVFNYRDVTERKIAEAQLEEARAGLQRYADTLEKRVEERTAKLAEMVSELESFSYSLAHDLRAPLRTMEGFAKLLEEDYGAAIDEQGRDYIRRIVTAAARLDALIVDALSYSRLSLGELPLERIDFQNLIIEIIQSYPNLSTVQEHICVQGPFPAIYGNQAALTQCISNLLGNAVKFARPDVPLQLKVWAESEGDYVRIWFQDNGIGIAGEFQDKIFEIFQRLHSAEKYTGTGIGLAIVRKAVSRMQGEVGVKSDPGQGSQFWIRLRQWFPELKG